jgi:hypothetical protein
MHPLAAFYLRTFGITVGAIAALIGIPVLVFTFLVSGFASGMCGTFVLDEFASPNGKLKAVLHQIDCGATTGFNSHVSIVEGSANTSQKDTIPKSFFVAEINGAATPSGKGGGPEVRLQWQADNRLEIQHHNLARVIRAENKSQGVAIEYRSFR